MKHCLDGMLGIAEWGLGSMHAAQPLHVLSFHKLLSYLASVPGHCDFRLLEILVDSNGKPKVSSRDTFHNTWLACVCKDGPAHTTCTCSSEALAIFTTQHHLQGSKGKRKSSAAEEQGKKKSKRSRKSKAAEEEEEEEAAEEQEEEEAAEDDGGSEDVDAEPAPKSASKGRGKGKASKGKGAGTSAAAAAPAQPPASPAPSTKRGRKAAAAAGGSLGDLVADAHALGAQVRRMLFGCPVCSCLAVEGRSGTLLSCMGTQCHRCACHQPHPLQCPSPNLP